MSASPSHAEAPEKTRAYTRSGDFVSLTKPRLNFLVLLTTLAAYSLGSNESSALMLLIHTLVGTALVAGGASALNQVWEQDTDRLMRRTRFRPVANRRLTSTEAQFFGLALNLIGVVELWAFVNPLTSIVAAFTSASYIFFYTPLKSRSSLSTIVGALPGALPAVIGWTAATNTLSIEAWVLFAIVFMWQMPHFLAIAWMYRDEYAAAGIQLLPVIEPDGRSTGRQAVIYTAALVPVSLMPTLVGLASPWYLMGALTLGAVLMLFSVEFSSTRTVASARRLFFGSIIYLPLLWTILVLDHRIH